MIYKGTLGITALWAIQALILLPKYDLDVELEYLRCRSLWG